MLRTCCFLLQKRVSAITSTGTAGLQRRHLATISHGETVEVCFVDPALIVEPGRLHNLQNEGMNSSIQPFVKINLPVKLAQGLAKGKFRLGDADDPESHWMFGRHGEIFEYKYCGSFTVQSGFASAVDAQVMHAIERGQMLQPPATSSTTATGAEGTPRNWADFAALVTNGGRPPAPFMFAGRVVDCESAGLYRLNGVGGDVEGVLISSEYESAA